MEADQRTALSRFRVALGFLVAPLASSAVVGLALAAPAYSWGMLSGIGLFAAVVFGYPTALLVALPAFLLLRRRLAFTPLACSLAGAAVETIPMVVVLTVGAATGARGEPAEAGDFAFLLAVAAGAGLVGGLAFRLIAGAIPPPPPPLRGPPPP